MRFFPAAAHTAFASPPFLLPAAPGGGMIRLRRWALDVPVQPPTVDDDRLPVTLHQRPGPHLRART